ncbi:hypothetical protein Skr01_25260 [Sphaerisporangium krabiense]|uniref:Fibronectin type-III domain-containing protein n=1 Tax=Sphaerisporangium krabiense TaxID=763782 RepID=A0A7W8ZAV3_9ACTN|nr:fibronectin type III domain-containing protein [Sphaerisporangium krabiense]MBB5630603.1 hypothetical protein [Sphaerisporangium krabiense]GII62441.1 hypothetical protein Skr01_25260 [Sphaerisporangium krabiense]
MKIALPRGDRRTAMIAAIVVGALGITAAVAGVGVSSAGPRLADVGAWLQSSARGSVVHANGLSGQVDGRIDHVARPGRDLDVVQHGATVLLVDRAAGTVSRIDPGRLTVARTREFPVARLQIVVAGDAAYAVDPEGTVQRVDPVTLAAVGAPVALPGPLGRAAADGGGTLWVPVPATGHVVPIRDGVKGAAVPVGAPGDPLSLTVAGGVPVVVDARAARAVSIGADGTRTRFTLPDAVTATGRSGVLSPATVEGSTVPVLVPGPDGLLLLLDSASGQIAQTKLSQAAADPAALGVPQALGARAYIPDTGAGRLIVWDSAANGFAEPIQVTTREGDLEVSVRDGLLWANDGAGDGAVVVDPEGRERRVRKDDPDVPGPARTSRPEPAPGTASAGDGGAPTSSEPTGSPPPRPEPGPHSTRTRGAAPPEASPTPTRDREPPPDQPGAPGSVSVRSGPGRIDVAFAPSASGDVRRYTLEVSPAGGEVTPAAVAGDGPFRFTVAGGDCAKEYTVVVVARWKGGEVRSEPSGAARPCVAPAAPANFQAEPKNHGADLSWSAPENAGGADVTYALSGAASKDGIAGTSVSVEGLKNAHKHTFTLKARNAAGDGQATASATADLAYPRHAYRNAGKTDALVRPGPGKDGEIGRIPKGRHRPLTVICQIKGPSVTDAESGETSDVWNRIEWNGGVGYLSDTLMKTPRGAFPAAPLFQCDD